MKNLFKIVTCILLTISINAMENQEKEIVTVANKQEVKELDKTNYFVLLPDEIIAEIANWLVIVSPLEDIKKNSQNLQLACKRCNQIKPVVNKKMFSEKIEYLISLGAILRNKLKGDSSPLGIAIQFDLLKYVTDELASNEQYAMHIRSHLFYAARFDSVRVAELLITKGALVNAKDSIGGTPLHAAARSNSVKVANLLIAKGALVNAKDSIGCTPLYGAAMWDAEEVVKTLIIHGALINTRDLFGMTPLHIAACHKSEKVIKVLFSRGADIHIMDNQGVAPQAAVDSPEIKRLFEENIFGFNPHLPVFYNIKALIAQKNYAQKSALANAQFKIDDKVSLKACNKILD